MLKSGSRRRCGPVSPSTTSSGQSSATRGASAGTGDWGWGSSLVTCPSSLVICPPSPLAFVNTARALCSATARRSQRAETETSYKNSGQRTKDKGRPTFLMLLRILTGLVLIPPVIYIIGWAPEWLFVLVLIATVERSLYEYFAISRHAGFKSLPA